MGLTKVTRARFDPNDLLAAAERRWTDLGATRPDLAPAIALHRALVRRQVETAALLATEIPLPAPDPARLAAKWARGQPAWSREALVLPEARLGRLALDLAAVLADTPTAGDAAGRLHRALAEGHQVRIETLLLAVFTRDAPRVRAGAEQLGLAADLLWLVGELALVPFVTLLAAAWSEEACRHRVSATALAAWARGYCPFCGSWPALVERCSHLHLRCSFCGAAWPFDSKRCVHCGAGGPTVRMLAPDPTRPGRAIATCDGCGTYLKHVAATSPTPALLLATLDLATADLDSLAAARGYGRPSLTDRPKDGRTDPPPEAGSCS